jgi:hypothetical protein
MTQTSRRSSAIKTLRYAALLILSILAYLLLYTSLHEGSFLIASSRKEN